MIHVLQFPYNGEPPRVIFSFIPISENFCLTIEKDRLVETPITRNEDHFVRNHGGIPEIDEEAYFFDVAGLVNNPKRITMRELKDETLFPRQSTTVTIQCSGTRRIEQIQQYPGDGDELINAPVSTCSSSQATLTDSTPSGEKARLVPQNGPVYPLKKSSNTAAVSKIPLQTPISNSSAQTPISRRAKSTTTPFPCPGAK